MKHADSPLPVAVRRERVQQRAAASRAAIADAWTDVSAATVALEAKAHRAVDWTRTLSAIAAVVGGLVALRRVAIRGRSASRSRTGAGTPGRVGPALRALATTTVLRRLVPSALRLYFGRP